MTGGEGHKGAGKKMDGFNCTEDGYYYEIAQGKKKEDISNSGGVALSPPSPCLKCPVFSKGRATVVAGSQMRTLMKGLTFAPLLRRSAKFPPTHIPLSSLLAYSFRLCALRYLRGDKCMTTLNGYLVMNKQRSINGNLHEKCGYYKSSAHIEHRDSCITYARCPLFTSLLTRCMRAVDM